MKFLIIFIAPFLMAKMVATYEAKYGWFGVIATAKGIFDKNKTNYKIKTSFETKGIAKAFSKNLKQEYISEGVIKNEILYPKKYIMHFKNSNREFFKIYFFKKDGIWVKKIQNGKLEYEKKLPFKTKFDILSLYFNLPKLLKKKKATFYAIGGRKKDGRVDIEFNKKILKANLYNKIFIGDKGVLYLTINPKKWIATKGMVKNVMKIGDLKGKITSFKEF